jgi:adenylate cyclase class 2
VLASWGAAGPEIREDADEYFNAPDRDFKATDEAFRIRRVGRLGFVTYKGPKRDAFLKTREEIEVALADGLSAADDLSRILVRLGYRPVAIVRKERQVYSFQRDGFPMQATLDTVPEVGRFVEVEIVATADQEPAAREALLRAAAGLGLQHSERRSYLELLLAARGSR